MGCLFSKQRSQELKEESETQETKTFSWDKRERVDPATYTIKDLKDTTDGRVPGGCNGGPIMIQSCEDSNIYVYDYISNVTVDNCTNCRIFLGPVQTSVFIRNCSGCKVMTACQQFRTRDCNKVDIFLACVTQPIIESSTNLKFGCFQYNYPELDAQFHSSGISVYNNNWSNIHDFTPVPEETNYTLLPEEVDILEYFPLPTTEKFAGVQVSVQPQDSPVPCTLGTRRKLSDQSCLIVFFNDGSSHERARNFVLEMKDKHPDCKLVQSKEVTMQTNDAERVFGSDNYNMASKQGPVIAFEYNGEGCIQFCRETVVSVSRGATGLVFISQNPAMAPQQIENFYNFIDMQMAV